MPTATEKFNKKYTEVVKTIEKNFADLKKCMGKPCLILKNLLNKN